MKNLIPIPIIIIRIFSIVALSFVIMTACSEKEKGNLFFTEADPASGFNFPYFLYLPEKMEMGKTIFLITESNNSGFASDYFDEHKEKALRTASRDYYIGNFVSRELGYPLLVPVFPRTKSEWKIYTHSLDRDVVLLKGHELERIDLQLLAMISDAAGKLDSMGYSVHDQILMAGFSASGTFASRFTAIHPEKVFATAAGGINGLLFLPTDHWDGIPLNYPVGTNDFKEIFGEKFRFEAFQNTPQFLFMGDQDDNDAIPYADAYDDDERKVIYQVVGTQMQPDRWNRCMEIYRRLNMRSQVKTFQGAGHEHPENIKNEIVEFFRNHLPQNEQP